MDLHSQIPNATGVVLGSGQLIVYAIYKNKSVTEKPIEKVDEEEGSAHLVKAAGGVIEMGGLEDEDEEANYLKNRSLRKGRSVSKPSHVDRQHSI